MKKTLIALALTAGATFSATAADIVDTAVSAGSFKTLVTAVQAAGRVDTLKGRARSRYLHRPTPRLPKSRRPSSTPCWPTKPP